MDTSAYSPASLKLLTYLPGPSQLNANGSLSFQKPSLLDLGEVTARFDQQIGNADRVTLRYFSDAYHLNGVLDLKNLLTYADQSKINYYNSLVSETHTFNPHLLNNFILSYQIENSSRGPAASSVSVADLGVNIWQPSFKQINQIQTTGFFNIGDNPQGFFRRANYTLTDDVRWQKGTHDLSFGSQSAKSTSTTSSVNREPSPSTPTTPATPSPASSSGISSSSPRAPASSSMAATSSTACTWKTAGKPAAG